MNDKSCTIEKQENWRYFVSWNVNEGQNILEDEIKEGIRNLLTYLVEEIHIKVSQIEVAPNKMSFILEAESQLNINKTVKMLQKKLAKALYKDFPNLKQKEIVLGEACCLIVTFNDTQKDIRIEKIIQSIKEAEHYALEDSFIDEIDELKEYLTHKKLRIIDEGENVFLVDQEAVVKEINLNCFACTKIHQYGCCCGSPCRFSSKNMALFDKHMLRIEEEIKKLDEGYYNTSVARGGLLTANGSIKEYDGHCSLLVEHEGVYKCIAHKYALDYNIPIYDICPLSCLMYPLEIIELKTDKKKKIFLLTSVLDDDFAERFGRWGSYKTLDVELRCINKNAHNEIFKEEDYRPVYKVNKNLLVHEFGPLLCNGIEHLCE